MGEDIRKKIAALLSKAGNVGASEAEALAAAQKAAQLMLEHGVSQEDVEFDEQAAPIR
ncbi:MAG: DUF2786 domain-containing protein, partial [Rhodobacterales bacterium]